MRKVIMVLAVSSVFAACGSRTDIETEKDLMVTDTTGMYNSNVSTDTATTVPVEEEVAPAAPKVVTQTRTVYVDRTPKSTTQRNVPTTTTNTQTTTNTGTGTTTTTGTGTTTTTPAPKEEDKGWSNSTKGAVIGGAAGAVGGAILSKKKGKGAIIGGVVGAAGGYILGKKKDNKQAADTTR